MSWHIYKRNANPESLNQYLPRFLRTHYLNSELFCIKYLSTNKIEGLLKIFKKFVYISMIKNPEHWVQKMYKSRVVNQSPFSITNVNERLDVPSLVLSTLV